MKRNLKLFLVFVLLIGLTGCVKYNVNMEVKDDKSVTLEVIYGMQMSNDIFSEFDDDSTDYEEDDDLYVEDDTEEDDWYVEDTTDDTSSDISVDEYKFLEDRGFKVEEFTEESDGNTVSGVKVTKTYANIDDITKDEEFVVDFQNLFSEDSEDVSEYFFYKKGSKYVANFVFDFSSEDDDTDYSQYGAMFDMKYTIKLPKESTSNNATSVSEDGKELTWNLIYGVKNEVNFEFALEDNTMMIVIIVCILVVVIGAVLLVFITKKGKNKNNTINSDVNSMNNVNNVTNTGVNDTTNTNL